MRTLVTSLVIAVVFAGACAPRGRGVDRPPTTRREATAERPPRPPEIEDLELADRIARAVAELERELKIPFSRNWFSNQVYPVWWAGPSRVERVAIRERLVVIRDAAERRIVLRPRVDPTARPNAWDGLEFQRARAIELIEQCDVTDRFRLTHPNFGCRQGCD